MLKKKKTLKKKKKKNKPSKTVYTAVLKMASTLYCKVVHLYKYTLLHHSCSQIVFQDGEKKTDLYILLTIVYIKSCLICMMCTYCLQALIMMSVLEGL